MGDLLFSTSGLANQLGFKTKDCLNMTIENLFLELAMLKIN